MQIDPVKPATISPLVLQYLHGSVVQYRARETLGPRTLPDYELVLIIEGQVIYQTGEVDYLAEPGSVILARPGFKETYIWDPSTHTRHAYLHFNIEHLPEDLGPQHKWPILHQHPPSLAAHLMRQLIERVAQEPQWRTTRPNINACREFECLLRQLIQPPQNASRSLAPQLPKAVQQSLNYMREILDTNPHYSLRLEELANRSGVSEKHLCRLFQSSLKHSPMQIHRLLKLHFALALLDRSGLPIKDIAERCGFDNPLYFTRCFTRSYGYAPTEIRKKMLRREPLPQSPLPSEISQKISW